VLIRVIRGLLSSICGLACPKSWSRSPKPTQPLTTHYSQLTTGRHGPPASLAPSLGLALNHLRSRLVAGACHSAAVRSVAEPTTPLHHHLKLHHNSLHLNHLRSRSQLTTHNSQLRRSRLIRVIRG